MRRRGARSASASSEPAGAGHPQYGLKLLLQSSAWTRDAVVPLAQAKAALAARDRFVSEAMRPASTAERGASCRVSRRRKCSGPCRRGHSRSGERARGGAFAAQFSCAASCRDARPVAALVTPDRGLARRVAVELSRWGIDVDDSAGRPLAAHAARGAGAAGRGDGAWRACGGDAAGAPEASARGLRHAAARCASRRRAAWSAPCCAVRACARPRGPPPRAWRSGSAERRPPEGVAAVPNRSRRGACRSPTLGIRRAISRSGSRRRLLPLERLAIGGRRRAPPISSKRTAPRSSPSPTGQGRSRSAVRRRGGRSARRSLDELLAEAHRRSRNSSRATIPGLFSALIER